MKSRFTASKTKEIKYATSLFAFLLIIWGFYRLLIFQVPEVLEVVIIKPIIWLVPTYYFLRKERSSFSSLGFTSKNLFYSAYFAITLGAIFAFEGMAINFIKYRGFNFSANIGTEPFIMAIFFSFVTAISEEIAFRGYIFTRIWDAIGNEWISNIVTSIAWSLIHLPIAFFDWKLDFAPLITYLVLVFVFSLGSTYVFARTKNILSSIFLHVLWQWPIILFR